jgi:hypothetical protein
MRSVANAKLTHIGVGIGIVKRQCLCGPFAFPFHGLFRENRPCSIFGIESPRLYEPRNFDLIYAEGIP